MAGRGAADAIPAAAPALAHALADAAGEIVRRHFRTRLAIDDKADLTPVTIADRAAEGAMRRLIADAFPAHGVIGEEEGPTHADADYVWVLDPIDGTKNFISGIPLFGTLIALVRRGRPVLGVIDQPILRERWLGVAGRPSTLNGAPVCARACTALSAATLYATSPDMFVGADEAAFQRLRRRVKLARYGADCYAYAQLASGFIDIVVERDLKPYDWCALVPVIEGAGGAMTDWQGRPLALDADGRVIACGDPGLVDQVRQALAA